MRSPWCGRARAGTTDAGSATVQRVRVSYPRCSTRRRRDRAARSPFTAAFLSLLFPGLGHLYAGAPMRALGFAAPPILLLALVARPRPPPGPVRSSSARSIELVGAIFVFNIVALVYRLVAIVDAYRVAEYLNAHAASGDGRLGGPPAAQPAVDRRARRGRARDGRHPRRRRPLRPPRPGRARELHLRHRPDRRLRPATDARRPARRVRRRQRRAGPTADRRPPSRRRSGHAGARASRSRRGTARSG